MAEGGNYPDVPDFGDAIAIVGMAGRFPGARSVEEFWQNQCAGTISVSRFSDAELEDWFDQKTRSDENFVRARGVLEDADRFDAELFGMYAREAALTDPQHRIFLEVALEALEVAALDPSRFEGPVGVFAGASMPTYLLGNVLADRAAAMEFNSNYQLGGMETLVGSLPDALATRVAYKLDLHGPALTVQSACSTSLLAVAQACQSLLMYQCDAALAGGVSITFPQRRGYLYQDGGMGSRDGTCRPFDKDACGTVFGSGAGAVVLKRLEDALRDKDEIVALIRGTGISNDGARKVGFTAPSSEGQAAAIASAIAGAAIPAASIGYVELHGTATPLGDPIEFEGLKRAFGSQCDAGVCVLGSAKANIGHLDAAAGVTGLIKAALCLAREEIPPLANFTAPNPHIDLEASPFRIERELSPWPRSGVPRRAGVSSFGVGGTNVHVVLEEAPTTPPRQPREGLQILPFSARTAEALEAQAVALADRLERGEDIPLCDVAYTLASGRCEREYRGAVVADTPAQAAELLKSSGRNAIRGHCVAPPPIVFMFPGQGSQYPGMGANLYRTEPVYREWIDRGAEQLLDVFDLDIREMLLRPSSQDESCPHPLRSTVHAQPALFLTQYALARLWMHRGVRPDAMIGHSVGELVAATVSGVLTFADGLTLVASRAALMQGAQPGAMLAVRMAEDELRPLLGEDVDLAAVNSPGLCVASGPHDAIERLEGRLVAAGAEGRRLHTSHAFHSRMMDPVVAQLGELARGFRYCEPSIPYVSGVTGVWAGGETAASGDYWARHCREPVRFADALGTLVSGMKPLLLEVGAGRTLSTFAAQGLARADYLACVTSLPDAAEAERDGQHFAEAQARAWCHGVAIDWGEMFGPEPLKVPLPSYQFQRKRYWVEQPGPQALPSTAAPDPVALAISETAAPTRAASTDGELPVACDTNRVERLCAQLAQLLEELSGESQSTNDWHAEFLELGFDSLFLGQVATHLKKRFGLKITFRQLMDDLSSIDALARHLDSELAADPVTEPVTAPAAAVIDAPSSPSSDTLAASAASPPLAGIAGAHDLSATFQAQLQAMQSVIDRQLDLIAGGRGVPQPVSAPAEVPAAAAPVATARTYTPSADRPEGAGRFKPFDAKASRDADLLSDQQRDFIAKLTQRYCDKMPGSKAQAARHRSYFSDPRTNAGFRPEWKEMVFPVVAARSGGAKIWDVDGNEFVDLVNGYGQTFFGHAPDFVTRAIREQLDQGFAIGPQAPLAGEIAARISTMVGLDRVTFCNTGSEAVMAAMRVARCVTGKDKVVVFNNDYHGQFDEVLVKSGGKGAFARALPIAPGIPGDSVANMVVLPYGSLDALEWIRRNADEIAAVIVEPVQSRHPELLPFAFLHELRAITQAGDVALVFDEVVTGFRTHPGGMQAVLGIRADMAAYGKVIGGGMPVGILAGSAEYMDALDGGQWQFGDESFPEVAPTFFAGTFVRHPLVLAACHAVLDHLDQQGPALQENLASRTSAFVERINREFSDRDVAVRAQTYSSWFMLDTASGDRLGALFNYRMRLSGVHILDAYPCFMTTEHSDADLDHVVAAVGDALDALQPAGIFAPVDLPEAADRAQTVTVPLTEPQLEVLLAAQMGPTASCAYNESMALEFSGRVDVAALTGAINDFVARHDAMRATIEPSGPSLSIAPSLVLAVNHIRDAAPADLALLKSVEAKTPFDLVSGPLLRVHLVDLADGTSVLVLTAHHIIFDGWTANLFAQEVAAFYRTRTTGAAIDLEPAETFATYAGRQHDASDIASADLDYWREIFATLPQPLDLPGDRPRPATKSFEGASHVETIDAELAAAAKAAGARLGCTQFATLAGAVQILIGRIAECEDVVLGCPTAGQMAVEDKVLAGHCVNFLPLRVPFSMATAMGDHLRQVKSRTIEAFDHGTATYGAIVRALGMPRNPNRTPLTDVQFNLEQLGQSIDFGTVSADLRSNGKAAVNFDLFFNLVDTNDGLRVEVDYSTDLFNESTIARWIENLRQILRCLAVDPAVPIGRIDLLGDEERAWLLSRNPQWPLLADDCSIPSEFAKAAREFPDRIALVADGRTMSYGELDKRTNRIANALRQRGIGKGDFVALLAARSIEAMELILGIIKAGAAYVPLDPAYPLARQEYVLDDCGASLILFGPGAEDAEAYEGIRQGGLGYEDLWAEAARSGSERPDHVVRADDPIYVMYTSGSTGKPKGVVVPHRGVVRLVVDQDYVQFGPDETFMLLTALGFDLCQFEMWGALLFGGKLAIVTSPKPSLADIERTIAQEGVTTALMAAALFHLVVEERVSVLSPLRQLVIGADVVSRTLVRRAQAALPHIRFVNGYGPTENSGLTTCYVFPAEGWGPGSSPIGQPIARSTAFIVDPRGQLSPQGSIGELWSGGEGVAHGYLDKPELTADKFVPHPLDPAQTVYRTGDYARWRDDGAIEFLGRIDGQLKINGMRVELDEIEAVLCEATGVGEAAVTVGTARSGAKTVHAFVTVSDGQVFEPAAIDRHVAERLPRHMHPATVDSIDALPLNANGKVDRTALLDLVGSLSPPVQDSPAVESKADDVEIALRAIWSDVLGVDQIGRDDAIFDLGADSLQIFRIAARMSAKGFELDSRSLLTNPTLKEVADLVRGPGSHAAATSKPALKPLSAYRRDAVQEGPQ